MKRYLGSTVYNHTGMMAHYKTEVWLNRTGQVAQSPKDYSVDGKDKKLSIHERLEINKKIIQEKQGKDKPERGADRGVK